MRGEELRQLTANAMSEADLQANVIELAQRLGWLVYHTYDSRRSAYGYPDLTMVRRGRLVFAELKRQSQYATIEQQQWLAALDEVATSTADEYGVSDPMHVAVWRPADWIDGTIQRVLT